MHEVVDTRGRALTDLRVSVTDRCNFRCTYCMPRETFGPDFAFLDRSELLSFEEIARIVRVAARLGVRKVRLTGGEPLLRRELPRLVEMIADVHGIDDIAMTTNGSLLADRVAQLRDAGLSRVTVSLDSLDPDTFRRMSDTRVPLQRVLDGIAAASAAGLAPVKVNTVVRRGVNDQDIVDLAAWARRTGVVQRFIEYMDVGETNGWRLDEVLPSAEVVERIRARWPVVAIAPGAGDGDTEGVPAAAAGDEDVTRGDPGHLPPAGRATAVAERWRYADGNGEFGVISSVTTPFCSTCVRARLSAVGELYTCLFATRGTDLRAVVRGGADDTALEALLARVWGRRTDRYSEARAETPSGRAPDDPLTDPPTGPGRGKVEMSYIGG